MKTFGLLGGLAYPSTAEYYLKINRQVHATLGKHHSAPLWIHSFDFEPIAQAQASDSWAILEEKLLQAALELERLGCQGLAIASNTMHLLAPALEGALSIPLVHIADSVGEESSLKGYKKLALLGTLFTMEKDFYASRLQERFDLEVITPAKEERNLVHECIYRELVNNIFTEDSRRDFIQIIHGFKERGAEAVILGCTEIPLLLEGASSPLPLLDTMELHVGSIVQSILEV